MNIEMADYSDRKVFVERLGQLSKSEYEEVFRIIKRANENWSENSNGVFFDVNSLSTDTFDRLRFFMDLCIKSREEQDERIKLMEALKSETAVGTA